MPLTFRYLVHATDTNLVHYSEDHHISGHRCTISNGRSFLYWWILGYFLLSQQIKLQMCWSWNSNILATWGKEMTHLKDLMLEKIEGRRRRGDRGWDSWMASPTQWTWVWASSGVGDGQGSLACCSPWGCKESDMTERLNWTDTSFMCSCF